MESFLTLVFTEEDFKKRRTVFYNFMREFGQTMTNIVVYNNSCLTAKCQESFFRFKVSWKTEYFDFKRVSRIFGKLLFAHLLFDLNDIRTNGGRFIAVRKKTQKFFVNGDRFRILLLSFVNQTEQLINHN